MDPITVTVGVVAIAISASLALAIKKYQELREKNAEIEDFRRSLDVYVQTYQLEGPDEELIKKCQAKIKELFKNGIEAEFNQYDTIEKKKAFAQKVAKELAACMNIDINNIIIEELPPGYFGATLTNDANKTIDVCFNEVLLVADPQKLIYTMCHEFKHCIQYQSFTNNKWGYSSQRVAQYLYSWNHYVNNTQEAYEKQIIELDANRFADKILNS